MQGRSKILKILRTIGILDIITNKILVPEPIIPNSTTSSKSKNRDGEIINITTKLIFQARSTLTIEKRGRDTKVSPIVKHMAIYCIIVPIIIIFVLILNIISKNSPAISAKVFREVLEMQARDDLNYHLY